MDNKKQGAHGHTYGTAVRGTGYDVVVEVQILVKHLGVVLDAAVPFIPQLFPARPGVCGIHGE